MNKSVETVHATNLNELFNVSVERLNEIAAGIINNGRVFDLLNICNAIVQKIFHKGTEEQKEYVTDKLKGYYITVLLDETKDNRINGFGFELENLFTSVLENFKGEEKLVAVYFMGQLLERLEGYDGESKSITDEMLGLICLKTARQCSVEVCIERFDEIINSVN